MSETLHSPFALRRLAIDMRDGGNQDTIQNEEEESISEDEVINLVPETLLPADGAAAVGGKDVFKFHAHRKNVAGRMAEVASVAAEAAKSKTPPVTPKSAKKKTSKRVSIAPQVQVAEAKTPTRACKVSRKSTRQQELRKQAMRTPNRMAKRASQGNSDYDTDTDSVGDDSDVDQDYNLGSDRSSSEEEAHSGSEDEVITRKENGREMVMACKTGSLGTKANRKRAMAEMPEVLNTYFIANAQQSLTSDHTLSKLEIPRMDQEALDVALEKVPNKYVEERKELYQEYHALFNTWMFQLCDGHNLLFHGLGSKRFLMDTFRTTMLAEFTHLVVNGYFPSITIKQVLGSIIEDVIGHEGTIPNPLDQVEFIKNYYTLHDEDLFLIIHNIDGPMLRAEKVQTILSMLAQVPNVHVIASVDHINAPLIWDQTKCSRFHWLWYDVTTFDPYIEETSYENSLLVQQSGVLALSSLIHVMRSLTPNSKQMFYLLANNQLEQQGNSNYIGMSKQDLYQRCREGFLVNSDLTLRAHLTEFKDHKLIKVRKGPDGMEYFYIPLEATTLKEFMDQQDDGD
ncbi:origin recognition complex subunit 2-like [Lineus longissimus]|uniref:origin recognition complex subunit 2-like n=1 Tax=Lineus longissimus TaxID=88925 RepID=UPI002B4CD74B